MINIPGYSLNGEIGRGGMAVVYRARQVLLDREVALKVLNVQLAQDPVYAQRFLQEARMLAALGHPHIVPVYDVGVTPEGLHYFSMQLFHGGDFGRKLREGIDETELVRVLLAVAHALGFAHARGYVHRDVTPANILFADHDRPVLTDFGIARALAATSRITASGLSVGTSHYMSPEQARGLEVDRRSDIYSLGVLLFEALAGKPPFDGEDGFAVAYAHVHEPVPRLPDGVERWQPLIDRAMAKSPNDRYDDCAGFIEGLRNTVPNEFAAVLKKEGAAGLTAMVSAGKGASSKAAAPKAKSRPLPVPAAPVPDLASPGMIKVAARPPSRLPLFLAAGLVLVGLGVVGAVWWSSADTPTITAAGPTGPEVSASVPRASDPIDSSIPSTSGIGASATASTSDDQEPNGFDRINADIVTAQAIALGEVPTVEDPVRKLLAMGGANLAAQRLTSPAGNNALDRYKLALVIEPGNAEANAGIAAVAQAYVNLANKQDPETALDAWMDYLVRAETIAREHKASVPLASATAVRTGYVEQLVKRGSEAAAAGKRDEAIALHQRALRVLPDSQIAQRGLREAEQIGQPGYVFRDGSAQSQAPEMVVVGKFALARREIGVGEFRAYWRDAGQKKFGGSLPSCRDRESFSIFRSSRKRSWQDPGFEQGNNHPVVCVSYAMAEGYARWLAARSGKPYRLPTASEWRAAGSTAFPAKCAGNVRDTAFQRVFGGREGAACSDEHAATAPTGRFAARKPGLYDVDGNVREWVSDCEAGNCKERLALGASWFSLAGEPASPGYAADSGFNTIGFRVLRELD